MLPTARVLPVVAALVVLTGCGDDAPPEPARPFDTVEELYEAAGGEAWCGDDLAVTLAPAVGRCGEGDTRVVLGTAFLSEEALRESVRAASDDELLVLVPDDPSADGPWFHLRSLDRAVLEAARTELGGEILGSPADFEDWLERNGG